MGSEKKRKKQHRKEDSKHKKKRKKEKEKEKEKEKRRRRSPSSSGGSSDGGRGAASHRELLLAAALGDRPRCRELVDQGTDVAYADAQGTTALHEVRLPLPLPLLCLFERGCSLMPDSKAPSPLCCRCLLLLQACRHGHLAAARLLLRRGADAGLGDRRGDTPAHLAARHGHLDLLAALLQSGGHPVTPPSFVTCCTVIHVAAGCCIPARLSSTDGHLAALAACL
jgi:NF-kappa-B inhibitor-like protein 1